MPTIWRCFWSAVGKELHPFAPAYAILIKGAVAFQKTVGNLFHDTGERNKAGVIVMACHAEGDDLANGFWVVFDCGLCPGACVIASGSLARQPRLERLLVFTHAAGQQPSRGSLHEHPKESPPHGILCI